MSYLAFAFVMLIGQLSPGPDFLLVSKNALNHGLRAAMFSVLGIMLGLTVHTVVASSGIALGSGSSLGQIVQYLGAGYLIYLAFRLLKSPAAAPSTHPTPQSAQLSGAAAFRQGLWTNLLNPKVVIFISAMLSQFLSNTSPAADRWIYGIIIVVQGGLCWALFARLLQTKGIRTLFLCHERRINIIFAVLLILTAIGGLAS